MVKDMFKSRFFKENRKKFTSEMKKNSIAIFFSKDQIIKGDGEYFDFCDPNIFYLTGIEQANAKLIIHKSKTGIVNEYLFIQKTSKQLEVWEGKKLSKSECVKISKIKNILYLEDFESLFKKIYDKVENLYTTQNKNYTKGKSEYELFVRKLEGKTNLDSLEILKEIRSFKSPEEIKALEKAIAITKSGFDSVKKSLKSCKTEREVEAILSFEYIKQGGKHSYHPIIALGKNACTLHYIENDKKLNKNELLLIDSGCEYMNYKADITRVFPVSGKFTKRQKEVYNSVLDVQKYAISLLKHGILRVDWEKSVNQKMLEKLFELKLCKNPIKMRKDEKRKVLLEYYRHSTGHFLGLETHDIGDYEKPFRDGQVITVEPGIYIDKEEIGIRIEDNVLITEKGCRVLSKGIPK